MKVTELLNEKKQPDGTYAGVSFSKETINAIKQYIKDNNIPNGLRSDKMHTTVIYSRKYDPDFKALGKIDPPWTGTPTELDVWKTRPKDGSEGSNCLVLQFKCEKLNERHEELMKQYNFTYDFPEYKTHISLSYDIGDMEWKSLPKFEGKIEIIDEYGEDLNLDWAKEKGLKKDE